MRVKGRDDRGDWPAWARWFHERRIEGESGVGDTARRLFAKMGGEQYKLLRVNVGLPCRCSRRQAEWNERFTYDSVSCPAG